MTRPINIALCGCGGRLQGLLRHMMPLLAETNVRVAALYDPSADSIEITRGMFPNIRIHDSCASLLAGPDIDWVMIGSWNSQHAGQVIQALEAGKHVFCEKPLATSMEDCLRIRAAVVAHPGLHFFFGLVLRYSPHYQRVKAVLDSGEIGRVISFEFNETLPPHHGGYIHGNWRRHREHAGTHMLEKCCHDLDLANWLMASIPSRVASFGGLDFFTPEFAGQELRFGRGADGKSPVYQVWRDPEGVSPFNADKSIVDNQVAILEYLSGSRATFHTNCHAVLPERRFYICGSNGILRADALTGTLEVQVLGPDEFLRRETTGEGGSHAGGDQVMVRALLDTMIRNIAPLAGIREGIASAATAFAIDRSLDEGRIVTLDPEVAAIAIHG
jgi:predicted dehydrogenase